MSTIHSDPRSHLPPDHNIPLDPDTLRTLSLTLRDYVVHDGRKCFTIINAEAQLSCPNSTIPYGWFHACFLCEDFRDLFPSLVGYFSRSLICRHQIESSFSDHSIGLPCTLDHPLPLEQCWIMSVFSKKQTTENKTKPAPPQLQKEKSRSLLCTIYTPSSRTVTSSQCCTHSSHSMTQFLECIMSTPDSLLKLISQAWNEYSVINPCFHPNHKHFLNW